MRTALFFAGLVLGSGAWAASCCIGGSPRTFIQLRRLQNYELGFSSSVRDVYGRYNVYGELEEADRNQTYTIAWGAGARLADDLQVFGVLPLVHQVNAFGRREASRTGTGDLLAGLTWTVVEHLFFDDWYPTVTLTAGAKFPTGSRETLVQGRRMPGTGNGLWEPFVGLGLKKDFEWMTLSLNAGFTRPFGRLEGGVAEGNRWELVEAAHFPLSRRLSVGGGASQTWVEAKRQGGLALADSAERVAGAFVTSTFFLTPLLDVTGTVDFALPADRFGVNGQAYRSFTLTMKYGLY